MAPMPRCSPIPGKCIINISLCAPAFQRTANCGNKSPNPVTELLNASERANGMTPPPALQPVLGGLYHQYCRISFSVRTGCIGLSRFEHDPED